MNRQTKPLSKELPQPDEGIYESPMASNRFKSEILSP